jgi:chromosome segregation ATPase
MESSKQHMHPSLVVINDEILSTQVRLMELYVKQAHATAANEAARAQERFQAELTALQKELKQKELALEAHQAVSHQADQHLRAELKALQAQLLTSQRLLEDRKTDLAATRFEAGALRERIAQLESTVQKAQVTTEIEVNHSREALHTELAALKGQLEGKESALQLLQASVREVEDKLGTQVQDLHAQLAAKTDLVENRTAELQSAQSEIGAQHIQQLDLSSAQTEASASEATRIRETLQAELGSLRMAFEQKDLTLQQNHAATTEIEQRLNVQLRDLESQLAEKHGLLETRSREIGELSAKTNDLQEQITRLELANKQTVKEAKAAARALEDSLHTRVQELEATVSEKAQGLQNRTVELENAQSEAALLRERIQQLELTGAQTEEAKNEADHRRESLQNELDNVHRALEQKDVSLAQHEAEFKESSELLHAQLRDLQSQRTEERALLENQKREIHSARSEITTLRDRVHELESAKAAAETNAFAGIERFREQYQLELAGLRAELAQSQLVLDERQTTIRALEKELNSEIHRLEAQLAEKQTLLDRGHLELREKGSEISALREEITQSQFARRQTEMLAATQAEQIRERVKAEVGALDTQLKEKEGALKVAADRARELESVFNAKIADLQMQLAEKQSLMQGRDIELTDLRSQISNLLAQVNDLERTNAKALEQQRIAASRLEQDLHLQVTELQTQLAEKLAVLGTRNDEIQALESKITGLVKRIGQAEAALKQAEAMATSEIEQIRRQSQADDLAARRVESDQKAEAFQQREAALSFAEQNLQLEINGLRAEVAEKHSLLQNRNDELLRVKTELDVFQERIAYLESAARQAELESLQTAEQLGEQTGIELDKLWNELSQKERVLEVRQVAVNDLEQNFQAQINSLRSELAEKQALLENPSKGFLLGEPTLTESQKEKLNRLEQLVETSKADNEQTLISSHNRRWRFILGRKRRWKS